MVVYTATEMTNRQLRRLVPWLSEEGFDPALVWSVRPVNRRQVWVRRFEANEFGRPMVMGGQPVFAPDFLHEAAHRFPLSV